MGKRVLISSPVHEEDGKFHEYLESLNRLVIPTGFIVNKYFYLHNCENLSKQLNKKEYEIINDDIQCQNNTMNFDDKTLEKLAEMRNKALQKARAEKYDYLLFVDSDIILHKNTLKYLLQTNKDIVGEIFWRWSTEYRIIPNCYQNEFREYPSMKEIRQSIANPGTYEMGCVEGITLIDLNKITDVNVNFNVIPAQYATRWEFYAFCLRAKIAHPDCGIFIDTHLPARQLVNDYDILQWLKDKELYG